MLHPVNLNRVMTNGINALKKMSNPVAKSQPEIEN